MSKISKGIKIGVSIIGGACAGCVVMKVLSVPVNEMIEHNGNVINNTLQWRKPTIVDKGYAIAESAALSIGVLACGAATSAIVANTIVKLLK